MGGEGKCAVALIRATCARVQELYLRPSSQPAVLQALLLSPLPSLATHTHRGHSLADPDELRSKDEKAAYAARDPIPQLRTFMLSNGLASEADIEAIHKRVEEEVGFAESGNIRRFTRGSQAAAWVVDLVLYASGWRLLYECVRLSEGQECTPGLWVK